MLTEVTWNVCDQKIDNHDRGMVHRKADIPHRPTLPLIPPPYQCLVVADHQAEH